jgi:hypothetical protein
VNPGPILFCCVVMESSTGWAGLGGGGGWGECQCHLDSCGANISSIKLALSLLSMASIVSDVDVFSQFTEKSK